MKVRHFATARRASLRSDHPLHRLGAVVVRGSRVISVGWNKYKTHPRSPHPFKHIHAEVSAIQKAGYQAFGADLYVYREGRDGVMRLSKPCKSCMAAINKAGVRRVFYTDINYSVMRVV